MRRINRRKKFLNQLVFKGINTWSGNLLDSKARLFSLLLFILFLHLTFVPSAAAQTRIMPLGDSITWDDRIGDNRTDGERISYRYRLWQLLTDAGYDFDFVGSQNTGFDIFPDAENEGHPGFR